MKRRKFLTSALAAVAAVVLPFKVGGEPDVVAKWANSPRVYDINKTPYMIEPYSRMPFQTIKKGVSCNPTTFIDQKEQFQGMRHNIPTSSTGDGTNGTPRYANSCTGDVFISYPSGQLSYNKNDPWS